MLRKLQVARMAIAHTSEGAPITSFDEETTTARACKDFIDVSRNTVLKTLRWSFSVKTDIPLEAVPNPPMNWHYAYLYPKDGLRLWSVGGGCVYGLGPINGQKSIFSNVAKATADYTTGDLQDAYDDDFALAWSYKLAILIAPRVTEGNTDQVLSKLVAGYEMALNEAGENNENEKNDPMEIPQSILAGGFEYEG